MKKIISLIMLLGVHSIYTQNSQQTDVIYQLIKELIDTNTQELTDKLANLHLDEETIQQIINKLKTENEKLATEIVQLKMCLAKMRINQSGKGPIQPKLVQAAQKTIEKIQNKNRKIRLNESKIQILQLANPNFKLKPTIRKKSIVHAPSKIQPAATDKKKK